MSGSGKDSAERDALRRSEARFRGFFEHSPVSLWEEDFSGVKAILDTLRAEGVRDLDAHLRERPELLRRCVEATRVIDVNRAAVALHRASGKEELLAGLGATFTPESLEAFRTGLLGLWEGRTELSTDGVVQTLAGERRHVKMAFSVLPGDEDALSRVLVSLTDVTEQRRAAEAVRESERRYREVFENSAEVMYLLEVAPDGRFRNLDVNPAFERSCGLPAAQVVGKYTDETVDAETARAVNAKYRRCVESGAPTSEKVALELPTGRRTYVSSLVPIRDPGGRVYRIVGISRDVTDQERAEEEVRTLNRELEARVAERTAQLQAAKDEIESYAHSISHDLRAPIRHVDAFTGLLRARAGAELDEQSLGYLDVVAHAARRMGALVDELLAFSRIGRCELASSPVDLGALTAEVVRDLELAARGRAIRWQIAGLPVVPGDRVLLRVVLSNLLGNAVKFTRTRQAPEIEVGSQPSDGEAVVFVRDNGVGFDMRHAGKLFGVFQRLHRADEFEGVGIGLASVRRIVRRHGGRTWAEGKPDGGATFWFALPVG